MPVAGENDKQINANITPETCLPLSDDNPPSIGFFCSEISQKFARDPTYDGDTCIRALHALRGVFRANELKFK